MIIRHEDLVGTFEQKKALVAQFNLIDDTFFSVVMEHNDAAEYLLTVLLGKPVKIIENKTQYSIRNIENHSVVLDALVEDEEHNLYNVEVQVGDKKNHERRIRYNRTAMDWSFLQKGRDFSELPETYMIFISDFDPFDMERVHYKIVQYVEGTQREYNNGVHIHYFNTAVKDGTLLSKLMQYFKDSDPNNKKFGALSKQVEYHKNQNGGVADMCKAVEEYAKEYAKEREEKSKVETIKNMIKDGLSIDKALKYTGIDRQTYEKYADRI